MFEILAQRKVMLRFVVKENLVFVAEENLVFVAENLGFVAVENLGFVVEENLVFVVENLGFVAAENLGLEQFVVAEKNWVRQRESEPGLVFCLLSEKQ